MDESVVELQTALGANALVEFARSCSADGLRVEPVIYGRQRAAPSLAPPSNRLLVRAVDVDRVRMRLSAVEAQMQPTSTNGYRRRLRFVVRLYAAIAGLVLVIIVALLIAGRFGA